VPGGSNRAFARDDFRSQPRVSVDLLRSKQLDAPETVPIKLSWSPFDKLVIKSVSPIQEYRLFNIDHRDDSFRALGKTRDRRGCANPWNARGIGVRPAESLAVTIKPLIAINDS
jgi:hypothetical protein